jgi:Zn-dependent peptidase ImmA (M78 family)
MLPNFRWQIFCHELCHILFHAGDQMQLSSRFVEYQERKANNFALYATAPILMLKEIDLLDDYFAAVIVLKDTFSISLMFVCKRLDHNINNHIIPLHKTALGEPKLAHHD